VNRRSFLKVLGFGAASVIGVGIGTPTYGWLEAHHFGISRHAFKLKGLETPLRLVQLSDLHFGRWHGLNEVRAWVDATLKERPDGIVITGDIVDGRISPEKIEVLAHELSRLTAPLGVFAVLGNHDYFQRQASWNLGTGVMISSFERAGLRYLRNAGMLVRSDFFLAGVDDFWMGNPDPKKAFQNAPSRAARLLLNHNPDLLPEISPSVGLTLCGHTHGGQIRAPFGVGLYSISKYGERFQMGFVKAPAPAFVSRGLGTTGPPIRTFCPAELVVLNLEPA
jgi:uncharacterized protein